jgi:hypothetical protein
MPLRRLHVESVVPQAPIDLVYLPVIRLHEADVTMAGVANLFRLASCHQRQRQSLIIEENDEALAPRSSLYTPQPEDFFQKLRSRRDIRDGEVEVVTFHRQEPPRCTG